MKKEEKEKIIDCPECEEGYISSKDRICWNYGFEVDNDDELFD